VAANKGGGDNAPPAAVAAKPAAPVAVIATVADASLSDAGAKLDGAIVVRVASPEPKAAIAAAAIADADAAGDDNNDAPSEDAAPVLLAHAGVAKPCIAVALGKAMPAALIVRAASCRGPSRVVPVAAGAAAGAAAVVPRRRRASCPGSLLAPAASSSRSAASRPVMPTARQPQPQQQPLLAAAAANDMAILEAEDPVPGEYRSASPMRLGPMRLVLLASAGAGLALVAAPLLLPIAALPAPALAGAVAEAALLLAEAACAASATVGAKEVERALRAPAAPLPCLGRPLATAARCGAALVGGAASAAGLGGLAASKAVRGLLSFGRRRAAE